MAARGYQRCGQAVVGTEQRKIRAIERRADGPRADDGRELFKHDDERASSELGGGKGGYGYTTRIPLKGLSPGLYVLKVEARSRLGKGATASREVQFRVVQ